MHRIPESSVQVSHGQATTAPNPACCLFVVFTSARLAQPSTTHVCGESLQHVCLDDQPGEEEARAATCGAKDLQKGTARRGPNL